MSMNLARFGLQTQALPNAREAMIGAVQSESEFFNSEVDESIPAPLAGEQKSGGFKQQFDYGKYGKEQDALNATNDSYTSDQDIEIGVKQQPNMAMGIDLDKLAKLGVMGATPNAIMQSGKNINEVSIDEAKVEIAASGGAHITKESAQEENITEAQIKEIAANFQKSMSMDNGEMAKDGVSASMAGAHQAAAMGRMMMG